MVERIRPLLLLVCLTTALFLTVATSSRASEVVRTCGGNAANEVFQHAAVFGINWTQACPASSVPIGGGVGLNAPGNSVAQGQEGLWMATAPAGLSIRDASVPSMAVSDVGGSDQFGGGLFWGNTGAGFTNVGTSAAVGEDYGTAGFPSRDFGFQLTCRANPCTAYASAYLSEIDLTVDETSGPTLTAGGVWGHSGWVRGSWPLTMTGDSPSGVCSLGEGVQLSSGDSQVATGSFPQDPAAWHQCNAGSGISGTVNTVAYPNGGDTLYASGSDAAGESASASSPLDVDNVTPSVALSTPDDANPGAWVAHAVSVDAASSAGPSGLAGTDCSVDGGKADAYPKGGLTVDGDGIHTVTCTATNNALNQAGVPATGTTSEQLRIDEAPPSVTFEPVNPGDPTEVIVDTGDSESGVASGGITIQGPHARTPTALVTSVSDNQLVADVDDGGRNGLYTLRATSCDAVGNCAQTSEQLHYPIRLGAFSLASFGEIKSYAEVVRRRVRVDYRIKIVRRRERVDYRVRTETVTRRGRRVRERVKVGGHYRTVRDRVKVGGYERRIRVVIDKGEHCGTRRVRITRHRWRDITVCRQVKYRIQTRRRIPFGKSATIHGLLRTGAGAPIANAPVRIATRPDDRGGRYRTAGTATTNARGQWSLRLGGGPSRSVWAYYPGDAVVEPASEYLHLAVPAEIRLTITPRILPWSHAMTVAGHLVGRFVPRDGVALRFLVRYPHATQWTPLQALRTNSRGGFRFLWSYHAGRGVVTYPFRIATTATESDYPYAASNSRPVNVTFGPRTPPVRHQRRHRR